MIDYAELLEKVRILEEDHEPDGWPAIRMKDVSALARMVEGAKRLRAQPCRLVWNRDGYWLDEEFVETMENAFYEAGK